MELVRLPLFLLNSVLFPGSYMPLRVFEPRYLDMVSTCLKNNTPFGIVLIEEGSEVGEPAKPRSVGTIARITDWGMPERGILHIVVHGEQRFSINDSWVDGKIRVAEVTSLPQEQSLLIPPDAKDLAGFLEEILQEFGPELIGDKPQLQDASWVGMRLAQILPIPAPRKQAMLEQSDPLKRLEELRDALRQPPTAELS